MSKILITSGCSFSFGANTWPAYLFSKLQELGVSEHMTSAMVSQGNGLISRGIQYHVIKALERYQPEDILVGVMWSHANRFDYRCADPGVLSWDVAEFAVTSNPHGWIENPRAFVDNAPKNWLIGNRFWDSEEFATYYKIYYSDIGAAIQSLEHILRIQYFLKSKGIPYFFTDHADENIVRIEDQDSDEITYLVEELDRDQYLPVSSMAGWIVDHAKNKGTFEQKHKKGKNHPVITQYEEFVDRIIYPWLIDRGYV